MTALPSSNASTYIFDVPIKPGTEGKVSATVLGLPTWVYQSVEPQEALTLALTAWQTQDIPYLRSL
jgi:hypothetical protein